MESHQLHRLATEAAIPGFVAGACGPDAILDQTCWGHDDKHLSHRMQSDTVFWVASITKLVTAIAALQLVEREMITWDEPLARYLPYLGEAKVLSENSNDLIELAKPITLRHLLTHTAGFGYETWSRRVADYVRRTGMPSLNTGSLASLQMPLVFQPGEKRCYGIGLDWAGLLISELSGQRLADYVRARILDPLGMHDTSFDRFGGPERRRATLYARRSDGGLEEVPSAPNARRESGSGGAGLYSTPGDVLKLLQSILRAAEGRSGEVLTPDTIAYARRNQIGALSIRDLPSGSPARSMDLAPLPGHQKDWSFLGLRNVNQLPKGRSAGSVMWAGVANTYFWIDFQRSLAAVVFAQVLPFLDPKVLQIASEYERRVYAG